MKTAKKIEKMRNLFLSSRLSIKNAELEMIRSNYIIVMQEIVKMQSILSEMETIFEDIAYEDRIASKDR